MNAAAWYEELTGESPLETVRKAQAPEPVATTAPAFIEPNINNHKELTAQDNKIQVGTPVWVRWGYGYGFRAEGSGVIVKVFEKSVQVKLDHDVKSPNQPSQIGWYAGFVLKGIPRYCFANMISGKFNYWHSVTPLE